MTCPRRSSPWFLGWPRVVDDGCGLVENWCRTLELAASDGAPWAVLAQDDVEPLPGLEEGLDRWLAEAPPDAALVSGFSMGWVRDPREVAAGVRWRRRRSRELLYVLLLAVRREHVPRVVAGVRAGVGPHDDERLSHWLDESRLPAYTHLPNVVQHRGVESVTGKGWTIGGRPRMSPTYPEGRTLAEVCGW